MKLQHLTRKQVSVVGIGVLIIGVIALSAVSMGAFAQQDGGPIDEREPNDNRSNATPISVGEEISGAKVAENDTADWYSFEASADTGINIRHQFGGPGEIGLYGPNGTLIQNESGGTAGTSIVGGSAEETGTYYVRAEATDRGYNYQFDIVTATPDTYEPDDNRDNASSLTGEQASATLIKNDPDWFAINATAGETVTGTVDIEERADGGQNVRIDLFGPDGERVGTDGDNATEYDSGTGTGDVESQNVTVEQAGTYYVRITGIEELAGFVEYNLTANVSGDSTTTTTTEGTATTNTTTETAGVATTTEETDTTAEDTTTKDTTTEQPTTPTTAEESTDAGDGKAKQPSDGDAADGGNGKSKMGSDGGDATDGGNGKSKGS